MNKKDLDQALYGSLRVQTLVRCCNNIADMIKHARKKNKDHYEGIYSAFLNQLEHKAFIVLEGRKIIEYRLKEDY